MPIESGHFSARDHRVPAPELSVPLVWAPIVCVTFNTDADDSKILFSTCTKEDLVLLPLLE